MKSAFQAFDFHGRFRTQFATKQSSKTVSTVLQTFSAGFAVIEAGKSVGNLIVERTRTKELGKQHAYERQAIEIEIAEAEKQGEAKLLEEQKRIQITLTNYEQQLKQNLILFQKQVEVKAYEFGTSMEVWRKEMELEKMLRKPLRKTLDAIEEMLSLANKDNCDFYALNSLYDQYQETLELYHQIVKDFV